jgi:hypothetical protein
LKAPAGEPLYLYPPAVSDVGVFVDAYQDQTSGIPQGLSEWRSDLGGTFDLSPIIYGPYLFVAGVGVGGGSDPGVGMISSETGEMRWFSTSGRVRAVASDGSRVFSADDQGYASSNPAPNGHTEWVWPGKDPLISLINTGGGVVVGDARGKLHLLSSFTGAELATFSTQTAEDPDLTRQHLLVAGGTESVGEPGTLLYALQRNRLLAFRNGLYGDLTGEGELSVADVVLLLQAIVGIRELDPSQTARGDVAPTPGTQGRLIGDGSLDVTDALSLLRQITGLEPPGWPYPA